MTDSYVQVPTEGSGKFIDHEQQTKGGIAVQTQRTQVHYPAVIEASYTRPNDTTAYTSGDQVAQSTSAPVALTFALGRFNGGGGVICGASVIDDSNPATKPTFELWLFNGPSAPTANNDNAAIAWSDGDVAKCIGVIEFTQGEVRVGGTNTQCQGKVGTSHAIELPYRCDPATSNIFGMVVVRTAYTPAALGVIRFRLNVRQE